MALIRPIATLQIIDPRSGKMTAEAARYFQQLTDAIGIIGDVVGTSDTQTLTNKTIDGGYNTLSDIATSSLATLSGSDSAVVTGTAGTDGNVVQWNADGDAVDAGILSNDIVLDGEKQAVIYLDAYTVATLPSGEAGQIAYASDLRVFDGAGTQETGGNGTGGVVSFNGSNWVVIGTNSTAVA